MRKEKQSADVDAAAHIAAVMAIQSYRHVFIAQICILLGTSLAAICFYLRSFEVSGWNSGAILGFAIAGKMAVSSFGGAIAPKFVQRFSPRCSFLLFTGLSAGIIALTSVLGAGWQIIGAMLLLEAASTGFGATFRSTVPAIIGVDADLKGSTDLLRLATNIEPALTPLIAVSLLGLAGLEVLIAGAIAATLTSASLIVFATLPSEMKRLPQQGLIATLRARPQPLRSQSFRAMIALNIVFVAATSIVLVNSTVLTMGALSRDEIAVAIALAIFGIGSLGGIILARHLSMRAAGAAVMLFGATLVSASLFIGTLVDAFGGLLVLWFALGLGCSLAQVPLWQFIERQKRPDDRTVLRKAMIASAGLSWIVIAPIAGMLGAVTNLSFTFAVLGMLSVMATFAAAGATSVLSAGR